MFFSSTTFDFPSPSNVKKPRISRNISRSSMLSCEWDRWMTPYVGCHYGRCPLYQDPISRYPLSILHHFSPSSYLFISLTTHEKTQLFAIWFDRISVRPHFQSQKKNVLSRYFLWVMIGPWILPSKNYWGIVSSKVCWFLLQTGPFPFVCSELNLFSGSYAC